MLSKKKKKKKKKSKRKEQLAGSDLLPEQSPLDKALEEIAENAEKTWRKMIEKSKILNGVAPKDML